MRVLHPALLSAQRQASVRPAIKISVGDFEFKMDSVSGATSTCHNTKDSNQKWTKDESGRILKVESMESPYKSKAEIVLNNFDGLLYDLVLKGRRLYISWGAITEEGAIYSTSPVLFVKQQTFSEAPGVKTCTLDCIGIFDLLGMDEASEKYVDDGSAPLGTIVSNILTSVITGYSGCKYYNVTVDDAIDDLWTGVYLGESFVIEKGETRAHALARLMDMTHASMRPGNEAVDEDDHDTIHVFTPSQNVQRTYTLERIHHRFYADSDSSGVVYPNEIIIKTPAGYSPAYTAKVVDAVSYSMNPCSRTELVAGLISNTQAQTIANTMIANIINASSGSSAYLPMDCGVEILDRIKVISKRSGHDVEGSIGSLTRVFNPTLKEPRYDIKIAFGKWYDPRAMDDSLGYGYGFVDSDEPTYAGIDTGHTTILAANYLTKSSGFSVIAFAVYATADGEYVTYKFQSGAGPFKISVSGYSVSSSCTTDISLDDVVIDSVDFVSTFKSSHEETLTEGIHTIKVQINDAIASPIALQIYYITISKSAFVA